MDKLSKIFLTDGSPFLPEVTKKSLDTVAQIINSKQVNPVTAIAYECLSLGEEAFQGYLESAEIMNDYYVIKTSDIKLFFQGFSTPLIALSSCCVKNEGKADNAILSLPEIEPIDNLHFSINAYILDVIQKFRPILKKSTSETHMSGVTKLFDHCTNLPYSKNRYYSFGVLVAQILYREFFTRIDIFPKAFSYLGEIKK